MDINLKADDAILLLKKIEPILREHMMWLFFEESLKKEALEHLREKELLKAHYKESRQFYSELCSEFVDEIKVLKEENKKLKEELDKK